MRHTPIAVAILLLSACAGKPSDDQATAQQEGGGAGAFEAAAEEHESPASPKLPYRSAGIAMMFVDMRASICGAMTDAAQFGISAPPPADNADNFLATYEELAPFPDAQQAFKEVQTALNKCHSEPTVVTRSEVATAVARLRTEMQLISEPAPVQAPKTIAELEEDLEAAKAEYRSNPDAVAEMMLAAAQAELDAARREAAGAAQ